MSKTIQIISHKDSLIALTEDGRIFRRRALEEQLWVELEAPNEGKAAQNEEERLILATQDFILNQITYSGPMSFSELSLRATKQGATRRAFLAAHTELFNAGTIVSNEDHKYELAEVLKPTVAEELDALKD